MAELLLALLMQATVAVPPQDAPPPSDDVVVTALRDIEAPDSAVTARTLGSSRTGSAAASRAVLARAQIYAACAGRTATPGSLDLLREALDGTINGARQQWAQGRLALIRNGCFAAGADNYYERGALFLDALARYAPGLRLLKTQTADPAVQGRFNLREVPKARFRLAQDRQYFETAVCLVRLEPELAVALTRATALDAQRRLEAAIVNQAAACTGHARHVYFDGAQFRFYIADAVYRWAVAARGAATLIPER